MKPGRYISMLWRGSIRRQLVLGFALASLALMLGFGYLILEQQRESLYRSSEERATSLAHALSNPESALPSIGASGAISGVLGITSAAGDSVALSARVVGNPSAGIQEVWVTWTATLGPDGSSGE